MNRCGSVVDRTESGQFVPGVSGNPNGRPKGSPNITKQLEAAVKEYIASPSRIHRLHKVIDRLLTQAEDGNVGAAKLLLDKIVPNAKDEGEDGGKSGGNTYVFRIENATFKATQPALPAPDVVEAVIEIKQEETT